MARPCGHRKGVMHKLQHCRTTPHARLRFVRTKLGISQWEFAVLLGVSDRSVAHTESGRQRLTAHMARAVAETFGVASDWLLLGKGRAPQIKPLGPHVDMTRARRAALADAYDVWRAARGAA